MDSIENISKGELKQRIQEIVRTLFRKTIKTASNNELYQAIAFILRDIVSDRWITTHDVYYKQDVKVVYYLSMEFLMGRFLGNTVINLAKSEHIRETLAELEIDYNQIEETEKDPGLGNGGLGRLAACFLDSLSTLSYPAYGCGIRYHYGLFEQRIENNGQIEKPDHWLEYGDPWGIRRSEYAVEVKFFGNVETEKQEDGCYRFKLSNCHTVMAVPYDYPVVGYGANTVNTLRLWDAEAINRFDLASFNQGNYQRAVEEQNLARVLSEVLYPADEFMAGKELRLKQQYFFVSATLQRVLIRFSQMHDDFSILPDKVQFQLNDTHPALTIAELMRLLVDEYGQEWDAAWELTKKTCAYTNHTIMSEALEKWPLSLFSALLPRVFMIVEEINRRFCAKLIEFFGNAPERVRRMAIIADGQVRMAYLAIIGSHSINGVAAIHTEILKKQVFKDFYEIFPDRFNNKTNGVTQRRWLAHCNPKLAGLISGAIGEGWHTNLDELKGLIKYKEDAGFRDSFLEIKKSNKVNLSNFILGSKGVMVDPDSIFDIQVKRMHEYKRQLLNVLHILDLYNTLKVNPSYDMVPHTFIFGGKAAASYHRAKLIIKLINSVADLINKDKSVNNRMKVLFMENYRVSLAEKLMPAADVSEQISTAGTEASGTGNMKFMINGAVTIGTLDGANVEILEEVGEENIFIFGAKADEILSLTNSGEYNPWNVYNEEYAIRITMSNLINGALFPDQMFMDIYNAIMNGHGSPRPDQYFLLHDFMSYKETHKKINEAYKDRKRWAEMAIMNTACSGKFSSDRTIEQYAGEVWDLKKVNITLG